MRLFPLSQHVDTDMYKLIMSPQHLSTLHIQYFLYQVGVTLGVYPYVSPCLVR